MAPNPAYIACVLATIVTAFDSRHTAARRVALTRHAEAVDCAHEGIDAYCAIQFDSVKPSLSTFLKFWLMGKPVRGWEHTGEMNAVQPDSGAKATIFVDAETNRVGLVSSDDGELGKMVQLSVFAHALYDELQDIAAADEAKPQDRLCYPPKAVDAGRESLPLPQRPSE
mmetsp:Transcript_10981/g.33899  ORF Transcript_10981/g.33899 Transcript_10981/m.33899 type:complete len:169 (-) Transcript_10981:19-525(-)